MVIIAFVVFHWYFSLFFQTFFHHRYSAHKMFSMSKTWERVFFIFSFIAQGSAYLSPYAYGILHRMHHANADTELDPHSPKYDKNLFLMMWRTSDVYSNILWNKVEVDPKYKKDLPEWHAFDRFGISWWTKFVWVGIYISIYVMFATEWWMYMFLPLHFLTGPVHGVIINWFAHKYGYVNFKVNDTSKNFLPFDFLMLGESYHNNHHKLSSRANFGVRWHEFDPIWQVIKLFNAIGIIKLRQIVKPVAVESL